MAPLLAPWRFRLRSQGQSELSSALASDANKTILRFESRTVYRDARTQIDMSTTAENQPILRRRWTSFGLRTLLVLVAVVALCQKLVILPVLQSRRELRAVDHVQAVKKTVWLMGPYDLPGVRTEEQAWFRRWLGTVLGQRVHLLELNNSETSDITPLGDLSKVEVINLHGTKISDLSPLASLDCLRMLQIQESPVTDLTPLGGLKDLQTIYLGYGLPVCDLTPLRGVTNMLGFSVFGTNVTDISALSGLKKLKSIQLQDANIRDLSPLQGLEALESLYVVNCPVSSLEPLRNLAKLHDLVLYGTGSIDIAPLSGLCNLTTLSLDTSNVQDLSALRTLKGLTSLTLGGTSIDIPAEDIAELQRSLPNCHIDVIRRTPAVTAKVDISESISEDHSMHQSTPIQPLMLPKNESQPPRN